MNVKEDRAALIGFLFRDGHDEKEQLRFIRSNYPRLTAKLDHMAEQAARVFGSACRE